MAQTPKCQLCIRITLVILLIFIVVHVILAILKAVFTSDIISTEVMTQLLSLFMRDSEISALETVFTILSAAFAGVTMLAVLPRICLLCSIKCCPKSCCPKFLVFLTFLLSLAVMIILFLLGSVFVGINTIFSKEEVERQCAAARQGTYDSINLYATDVELKDMYKGIDDVDVIYASSITSFMCTDFCICPGTPADAWWKQYDKIDEAEYNKWGRSKAVGIGPSEYNGVINLDRFTGSTEYKPLFFSYDPLTQQNKPNLVELQSETFQECIENSATIVEKYKQQQQNPNLNSFGASSVNPNDPRFGQTNEQKFESMANDVDKPSEKYITLIKFIEDRYKCSGLCTPSLFYLTLSVKEGPPTQACLPPFIGEVAEPIGNLGSAMIASAVFFLLVIILVWPVCCYKAVDPDSVKPMEGGEFELAQNQSDVSQINDQTEIDATTKRNQVAIEQA